MINIAKRAAKLALDEVVVPLYGYVSGKLPSTSVTRELERRTAAECADYVQEHMPKALQFDRKRDLWAHVLGKVGSAGLVGEFGVWKGASINAIAARLAPRTVHGFDSFQGLKEDWAGWKEPKGRFSLEGRLPKVMPNVRLVPGWYDETLPRFLRENGARFDFVHLDSDTYESTRLVLELIADRITPGTVIVFDEYLGYRGWRIGEFKAWQEFVQARGRKYEYLAFTNDAVALRVVAQ